jgi:glycosyltransferase involved in cell wall biosynthesis
MNSTLAPGRFHVVIPCYNCEKYIEKCLKSLQAQTFTDWNGLVADDASSDKTAHMVRLVSAKDDRIALRVGEERAWLMGNTLNALKHLDIAPNDVVAILDGDDWIMPDCLEKIWNAHLQGFDLVYTNEDIDGQNHSIAAPLITSAPVRKQSWCFSQLRSFKGYLFNLLDNNTFLDRNGHYFRAAGDLALYMPMAELVGPEKIHYIPERLYHYRVHETCNFKIMRDEQLKNNWDIRNRPALERQTIFFDIIEDIHQLSKSDLVELGRTTRQRYPRPFTINLRHVIPASDADSWQAYHNLWIDEGVYLSCVIDTE